ncbi:hypothetical protein MKX03_016345 [Papaver bracteatum]|nr:hypothetical protein MKX03_016345 [Papaver bracteatum]
MGVSGTMEYLDDLMSSTNKHKKMKQMQTVELKIKMDCDGCELKIKNALSSMSGVKSVEINMKQHKVTVTGYVEASKVVKKAKSTGKKVEIWTYVPYELVGGGFIENVVRARLSHCFFCGLFIFFDLK